MDSSFQDSKSIPEYNPGIPSLNVGNRLIEAFWCLVSYKRVTSFTLASLSSEFYSCFTVSEHLEQQSISAPWWNLSAFLNLFVCLSNEATALKCRHCGGSSERIQNLGKCVFFFLFFWQPECEYHLFDHIFIQNSYRPATAGSVTKVSPYFHSRIALNFTDS